MKNLRKYGIPPYQVALLHGGPGGAGEMSAVAKKLSSNFGVLEPLQTKHSVNSQVAELKEVIENNTHSPITLVGYSWGAWLALIFTAENPTLVNKLILIGSGPFDKKYTQKIMPTRIARLSKYKKKKLLSLMEKMKDLTSKDKNIAFSKIGKIISEADSYKPLPHGDIDVQADIYEGVWPQASELRESGKLLTIAKKIKVPVVAIHGNYDPHPANGVSKPLKPVLKKFRFILLDKCGHTPWYEKEVKDKFFTILLDELKSSS